MKNQIFNLIACGTVFAQCQIMTNKTTLLFSLLFFCMSCTRNQYFTVSSELPQNKDGYVFENDTLQISYRFIEGEKFEIALYNKSLYPIFLHWNKSSVAFNSDTLQFTKQYLEHEALGVGYTNPEDQTKVIENAKKQLNDKSQLPPLTKETRIFKKVPFRFHKRLRSNKQTKLISYKNKPSHKLEIGKNDSRYAFSSKIIFSFADNTEEITINHKFGVSNIIEVVDGIYEHNPNQIEREKLTVWGGFLATIVGIAVLSVKALLES